MTDPLSLQSTVLLTPLRHGLQAGHDNTVDVLLRVQAADPPEGLHLARRPQSLALVIDRSGSMGGRPLAEARRCAQAVVARLRPDDTVAVVTFDHQVDTLCTPRPRGDGRAIGLMLEALEAGGTTDLHGGWAQGRHLMDTCATDGLRRVILLSDGCANHGLTDVDDIARRCAQAARHGVTTSTYGLGRSFHEDLMVAMARAGQGSSYYGDTAADLMEPFEQELDLLAHLALTALQAQARPAPGVRAEWLNDLPRIDDTTVRLPDLAWGAEAWALLRLTVPAEHLPAVGAQMPLLQVAVDGRSMDGEPVRLERTALSLPVCAPADWAQLPPDDLVARRVAEVRAAALLQQMRAAAREHAWATVDKLLAQAREELGQHEWLAGILAAMQRIADSRDLDRLSKETLYSSERLGRRLAAKHEGVRGDDRELPAFLRRKLEQGSGSTD